MSEQVQLPEPVKQTPCGRYGLCPPEGCWSEHCVVDQPQEVGGVG